MPINVHVKARPEGGSIEWDVDFKSPPDPGKVKIELPRGAGPEEIVFHLVPTHGLDVEFNPDDPIWVSRGDRCPDQRGLDPQISIAGTSARKLRIHNANSGAGCTLHYQLNFLGADPCDPIIINGGGGGIDGPID